jgi:hypothetical protein
MPAEPLCRICHGPKNVHVHEPPETCKFTPVVHHAFTPGFKPEAAEAAKEEPNARL